MWTLSGFSDEISADFTEQCRVAAGLGLATNRQSIAVITGAYESARTGRPVTL